LISARSLKIIATLLLISLSVSASLALTISNNQMLEPNVVGYATTLTPWPMFRHDSQHTGYTPSRIPSTVKQKWNFTTLGPGAVKTSPVVADGMVFVGSDDGNFYALNQTTGKILWFRSIGVSTNHPAVDSSKKVFIGIGTTLYALNKANGATGWAKTWHMTGQWYSPSTIDFTKGLLFIGAVDSYWPLYPYLFALSEIDGSEVWSNHGGTSGDGTYYPIAYVYTSPAVSEGRVFVGSDKGARGYNFWASNETTGAILWSKEFSAIRSSPSVAWRKVFFGCSDGKLYALDVASGEIIWNRATGGSIESSPAVDEAKGLVFVGSNDGKLYSFTNIGVDVWQHNFGQAVTSSPVVGDGKVLISVGNTLYALSETTGNEIWRYTTGGNVAQPAVADGTIFLGSEDGHVYALSGPTIPTKIAFALKPNPAIFGQSITLLGNLTAKTNAPISGAKVTVKSNGTAVATLTTNSTGWFKITGKQWFKPSTITAYAGTFNITVSYIGSMQYLPSSYWKILTVKKAATEIYAKFSINPVAPGANSTLKGILVDRFSNPIKYAKVTLRYSQDYGLTWTTIATLTTSSYGTFSKIITAPSTGTYIYRMKYAGTLNYLSSTTDIPLIVR